MSNLTINVNIPSSLFLDTQDTQKLAGYTSPVKAMGRTYSRKPRAVAPKLARSRKSTNTQSQE